MALNRDQEQLMDWYLQGESRLAFRHGLNAPIMAEWLSEQGYYGSEQGTEIAGRMLAEFKAEQIWYRINCLGSIQSAVWLLLLSDHDKDQGNVAEQINTVVFDVVYGVRDLANVDGTTGLYQVSMTVVADTELDQADIMNYIDQRVADLSDNERELLELLSSPQQQPRAYYFGLIDLYRALD